MSLKHIYQTVSGWFSFPLFYSLIVNEAKDGYHIVEIGSWKGMSACYMAVEIVNSGKKIKFDCIDTWEGSEENIDPKSSHYEPLLENADELYNHFLQNIKPVQHVINPIRKPSAEAVKLYKDNSLDCAFIDAAHDYENVCIDIKSWLPKIKKGGTLAGHDWAHAPVRQALNDVIGLDNICKDHVGENVWSYKVQ